MVDKKDATSSDMPCSRLHLPLLEINTASRELKSMMQAARVKELNDRGHNIRRHLIILTDDHDRSRPRIALYFLSTTSVKAED